MHEAFTILPIIREGSNYDVQKLNIDVELISDKLRNAGSFGSE